MGTRTELFLRVELDEDLPDEVVVILDACARGEAGALEDLPEYAFFETPGWDSALRHRCRRRVKTDQKSTGEN